MLLVVINRSHFAQSLRALTRSAAALEQQLRSHDKASANTQHSQASSLISLRPATRRHRALALYLILAKRSWDTADRPILQVASNHWRPFLEFDISRQTGLLGVDVLLVGER